MTNRSYPSIPAIKSLFAALLTTLVVGCSDGGSEEINTQHNVDQLKEVMQAKINAKTPEDIAEVFALGSNSTELQRDLLNKELIGSVVEWTVQVYDIQFEDGVYKVITQPFSIQSKDAVNMLRASISVHPRNDHDHEIMRAAKTNDTILIRGKIQSITLRAAILIEPAVLADATK